MKAIFCFLFILNSICFAQIAPFVDFNGQFKTFYKGAIRTLELQGIQSFQAGDDLLQYMDIRGNFKIYDGESPQLITIQLVNPVSSDNLVAWTIAQNLYTLEGKEKIILTNNCGEYIVKDSLILFQDTRFKTLNVYYNGEIQQIMQQFSSMVMPNHISENCFAFKDNGEIYKVFMAGKIIEIGNTPQDIQIECGTDIACFNDPINRTFAVVENGVVMDVESQYVIKYKTGTGFIVYEDMNGNLMMYKNNEKVTLSNFYSGFLEIKDNTVVWGENNQLYTWFNNQKIRVCTYIPTEYELKNNTFAFKNNLGGISVYQFGTTNLVTNQLEGKFKIYQDNVLIELFNKRFLFYSKGKTIEN